MPSHCPRFASHDRTGKPLFALPPNKQVFFGGKVGVNQEQRRWKKLEAERDRRRSPERHYATVRVRSKVSVKFSPTRSHKYIENENLQYAVERFKHKLLIFRDSPKAMLHFGRKICKFPAGMVLQVESSGRVLGYVDQIFGCSTLSA